MDPEHAQWGCSLDNSWLLFRQQLTWVRSLPQRSPSTLSLILHSASLGTTPLFYWLQNFISNFYYLSLLGESFCLWIWTSYLQLYYLYFVSSLKINQFPFPEIYEFIPYLHGVIELVKNLWGINPLHTQYLKTPWKEVVQVLHLRFYNFHHHSYISAKKPFPYIYIKSKFQH